MMGKLSLLKLKDISHRINSVHGTPPKIFFQENPQSKNQVIGINFAL